MVEPLGRCELCDMALPTSQACSTRLRLRQRIPHAALEAPGGEGYVFRTRSHAVFDRVAMVCPACRDRVEGEETAKRQGLRSATLGLALVALVVVVAGLAFAVLNPDSGPDLVRVLWPDPNARPQPLASQPAASPQAYRPPF